MESSIRSVCDFKNSGGVQIAGGKFLILFAFIFGIFVTGALFAGEDPRYSAATSALRKKDFQEGVKLYYKFIVLCDPSLSVGCRKRDLAAAFVYFTERRKKDPTDSRALYFLSLIDRVTQRMDRAGKQLDEVRNRHPKSNLLTFVKGEYCFVVENIVEGTQFFMHLKETPAGKKLWDVASFLIKRNGLDPKSVERKAAMLKRAYRHIDLLERDQAEQVLKTIMKDFPDDQDSVRALADLYMEMKKFDQAQAIVSEWRGRQGRSPLTPLQEGRLLYFQGRYSDVIKCLEPLFKREPANEYAGMFLAESYFQTGNYQKAVGMYKCFFDADQANISIALRYATSLECTGKATEAIQILDKASMKSPRDLLLQLELGGLLERQGKLVDASGYYRKVAFEAGPLQGVASQKLAAIYRKTLEGNPAFAGSQPVDVSRPLPPQANIPSAVSKTKDPVKAASEHQDELNKGLSNVFK